MLTGLLTVEEPLEPDLPICDPHHHLWDLRPTRVAPRYLLDEILADVQSGHNVVSTVFIECASMFKTDGPEAMRPVGETEFVNGIAAMSASGLYGPVRIAAGIVGTVDLRLGDAAAAVLDAHLVAGGGRFRGIRLGATWDPSDEVPNHRTNPPNGLLLRQDFRAGFAHLAPRQLTFEAWCYHHQIPEVTDLARAFPNTTIILDHFGGPIGIGPYAGKADEVYAQWRAHMGRVGYLPQCRGQAGRDQYGGQRLWHTARGAVALERLHEAARGDLVYPFTKPWSDGTTGITLAPLALLEQLVALVPLPRVHLVRYGGCLAPHTLLRGAITPTPRQPGGEEPEASPAAPYWRWARLLKRGCALDRATGPLCRPGALRILAAITQAAVLRTMLRPLTLSVDPPPSAPARSRHAAFDWVASCPQRWA